MATTVLYGTHIFKESERGSSREHPCEVQLKSNQYFQRRRSLKKFIVGWTDGCIHTLKHARTTDNTPLATGDKNEKKGNIFNSPK